MCRLLPLVLLVAACNETPEAPQVPMTAAPWRGVYRITEVRNGCNELEKASAEELFGHGYYAIEPYMMSPDAAVGTPCASPEACWEILRSREQSVTVVGHKMDLARDFTYAATQDELRYTRVQHLDMRKRTVVSEGSEVVRTEGFDDAPGPCRVTKAVATMRRSGEGLAFEYRREVVFQPDATECEERVVPAPTDTPVCDGRVQAMLFSVPRP